MINAAGAYPQSRVWRPSLPRDRTRSGLCGCRCHALAGIYRAVRDAGSRRQGIREPGCGAWSRRPV